MKYTLIRENALEQALTLYRRNFNKAYVSETGIYPYHEFGLDSLKKVMVLEPSCVCDLERIIVALRASEEVTVEVEHLELPERISIDGSILYPSEY